MYHIYWPLLDNKSNEANTESQLFFKNEKRTRLINYPQATTFLLISSTGSTAKKMLLNIPLHGEILLVVNHDFIKMKVSSNMYYTKRTLWSINCFSRKINCNMYYEASTIRNGMVAKKIICNGSQLGSNRSLAKAAFEYFMKFNAARKESIGHQVH